MPIKNWEYDMFFNSKREAEDIIYTTRFDKKHVEHIKYFDNNALECYRLNNLEVNFPQHSATAQKNVLGNIFVVPLDFIRSHYHFLQNLIGQYVVMKNTVPDLKVFIVMHHHDEEKQILGKQNKLSQYVFSVLNKLDVYEDSVFYLNEYSKITFENYYIMEPDYGIFSSKTQLGQTSDCPPDLIAKHLIDLFEPFNRSEDKQKIFISRAPETARVRKIKKKSRKFQNASKQQQEYFIKSIGGIGGGLDIKLKYRYISFEDERMLEQFFKSLGYKIINPGMYSLEDQIKIFENASHIAGLSGAGFINTIFSPTGANVFILNTSSGYDFDHGHFPRACGHKVFYIPEIFKTGQDIIDLTGQDILDQLKKFENIL